MFMTSYMRKRPVKQILFLLMLSVQVNAEVPRQEREKPEHHTTEGFRNYPVVEAPANLGLKFYWNRFIASFKTPEIPKGHMLPEKDAIALYKELQNENTVTWIGQSTLLMKINGTTILTDPYFSKYASPFIMGPSRFVNPGISAENLPPIDIIIVSHNHYDHLDTNFIESIVDKDTIHVFVPLKLGSFFSDRGFKNVYELDWYGSKRIGDIRFMALPSVHYSGRGMDDKNQTLWCSWAISSPSGQYYFIGDSAYSPTLFKEIGEKFGTFDLAMLGIGTYGNRKYGVNNHTTPEEAVAIGKEINAKTLLGIHWGTIDLSDEPPWEPPKRFHAAARKSGYLAEETWTMKIGETRRLPDR